MSSDNFEELDNASLRGKCLEYGLPNVPITNTSRKILIKKLRAAIAASDGVDDKKTKRRETIHGTKIPTLKESASVDDSIPKKTTSKTNTRRTIAASSAAVDNGNLSSPATVSVSPPAAPSAPVAVSTPAPVTQRRRSGRVTPSLQAQVDPVIPTTNKRKTNKIEEEEDEDYDEIIEAVERAESTLRAKAIGRDRKSRSSSLTKSSVISTSYSVESGPEVIQEAETDSDLEIVSDSYDNTKPSVPFVNERPPYVFSAPEVPVYSEPDVISTSRLPTKSYYEGVFSTRKSADPDLSGIYSHTSRFNIEPESYKPYSSESIGKVSSQKTTTRYTTGSKFTPEPKVTKRYTTYVENSDDPEDDGDAAIVTPYYSDFARKLEQLKTATFNLNTREVSMKREKITNRRYNVHKETFIDSCRNYMIELDQKYKIKRNILIAFLLLLILTIYVFVFY